MEFVLYCDESSSDGKLYGDFFGGCLVSSSYLNQVVDALNTKKQELNLNGELKWTKVTANYLDKYIEIINLFFDFVKAGKIKVRVMFRNINDVPSHRPANGDDEKYFKLYYQFIKHAFGLKYIQEKDEEIYIRIYLDQLPDKKESCDKFKEYLRGIPAVKDIQGSGVKLRIRHGDIAEVCSHDHVLLQCVDIITGAMYFRLNNLHKEKPVGARVRGKRTIGRL